MPAFTITAVQPEEKTWRNDFGEFRTYHLRLEGQDKVAHLNQKAETAPPAVGAVMDLDLTPHKRFPDVLQAKKVQTNGGGFGGGGGRGRSPEEEARTRKSIQMQHAQKCAVDSLKLAAEFGDGVEKYRPPSAADVVAQVKVIASALFQQIEDVQR